MTKRNEQTGKKVASKASRILMAAESNIMSLEAIKKAVCMALDSAMETMRDAQSVAGSALTQSPDKPKGRK